ncbi:MAG: hypothetical protein ACOC97_01300 [Myxococcota bacterium]
MRWWLALVLGVSLAAWGCANGDGPPNEGNEPLPDGGGQPDGGDPGHDGGTGDDAGTGDADGERTCTPEPGLGVDPSSFQTECGSCGGTAHCVPESVVPEDARDLLGPCDGSEGELCVPDKFIENSNYVPIICTSLNGQEGRCMSTCIPQVAEQAALLPQANCDEGEVCAPCYDPTSCEDTDACTQSCDAPQEGLPAHCEGGGVECPYDGPPVVDPSTFAECGGGGAHCVPPSQVPEEQLDLLADCEGTSDKCVPDELIESAGQALPDTCSSVGEREGRCLHRSIPQVAEQVDLLPQDSCEDDELCAPCYDPRTGESTGACEIACDEPEEGPQPFEDCCSGLSKCVPSELVPEGQSDSLVVDSCDEDAGELCAPKPFLEDDPDLTPCDAQALGFIPLGDGVCLPECLDGADLVTQSSCGENEKCIPCSQIPDPQPEACQ